MSNETNSGGLPNMPEGPEGRSRPLGLNPDFIQRAIETATGEIRLPRIDLQSGHEITLIGDERPPKHPNFKNLAERGGALMAGRVIDTSYRIRLTDGRTLYVAAPYNNVLALVIRRDKAEDGVFRSKATPTVKGVFVVRYPDGDVEIPMEEEEAGDWSTLIAESDAKRKSDREKADEDAIRASVIHEVVPGKLFGRLSGHGWERFTATDSSGRVYVAEKSTGVLPFLYRSYTEDSGHRGKVVGDVMKGGGAKREFEKLQRIHDFKLRNMRGQAGKIARAELPDLLQQLAGRITYESNGNIDIYTVILSDNSVLTVQARRIRGGRGGWQNDKYFQGSIVHPDGTTGIDLDRTNPKDGKLLRGLLPKLAQVHAMQSQQQ